MPTGQDFDSLIRAEPDNLDHFRAYADWLQSVGDPRGELMSLQVVGVGEESDYRKRKLDQAGRDWLADPGRARALLGPARNDKLFTAQWRCGFFETISNRLQHKVSEGRAVCAAIPELLRHPSSRFLRRLVLRPSDALPARAIMRAIHGHVPVHLQSVAVLTGTLEAADAEALCAAAPEITSLEYAATHVSFGRVTLEKLRELSLVVAPLTAAHVADLRRARWPRLEALSVGHFTADGLAALREALQPSKFDCLEELSLGSIYLPGWANRGAVIVPSEIAEFPIIARLRRLTLTGPFASAQVHDLIQMRDRLSHLERFSISLSSTQVPERASLMQAFGERMVIHSLPYD